MSRSPRALALAPPDFLPNLRLSIILVVLKGR